MPRATKKPTTKKVKSPVKSARLKKEISMPVDNTVVFPTSSDSMRKPFFSSKAFRFGVGIIVVLAVLAYIFKDQFIVATVNGQIITRAEFNKQMESQVGKQVLQTIITKALIEQEAKKRNITVSQSEIDDQVKTITDTLTKQGQSFDQALAAQGMTKTDFIEQLKIQKLIEKMLAGQTQVSDKEVADYIDKNKDSLPQGQDDATMKASVKQQLQQQKLSLQFQQFLADLQKKAQINQFVTF